MSEVNTDLMDWTQLRKDTLKLKIGKWKLSKVKEKGKKRMNNKYNRASNSA